MLINCLRPQISYLKFKERYKTTQSPLRGQKVSLSLSTNHGYSNYNVTIRKMLYCL